MPNNNNHTRSLILLIDNTSRNGQGCPGASTTQTSLTLSSSLLPGSSPKAQHTITLSIVFCRSTVLGQFHAPSSQAYHQQQGPARSRPTRFPPGSMPSCPYKSTCVYIAPTHSRACNHESSEYKTGTWHLVPRHETNVPSRPCLSHHTPHPSSLPSRLPNFGMI